MKTNLFKNEKFKDFLYILALVVFFIFISVMLTKNGKFVLGSKTDFDMQHYSIPEYFRTLFYSDHKLLPDFALNLGLGENIYYLSYYGLLNPIILVSYLFPFISMLDYIIISMMFVVISSCILLYYYFKKNNYSSFISFILTFMFLTAAPIIFHSHRHIMFVNYFPFLILGFYGVDNFINKKKSFLLILSTTLIIFTSYYYSIPSILVLFTLAIYKYLKNKDFNIKDFFKFSLSFVLRIMIAILISAVLLLPTVYTILNSRVGELQNLNILDLFIPDMYMFKDPYSIGLTYIALIATILIIFTKKKENIFLSIVILLFSTLPVFNYMLNGFLYIYAKVLIPFIPLVLIAVGEFLIIVFKKNKYLKYLAIVYIFISSTVLCMDTNTDEKLMTRKSITNDFYKNYSDYVNYIEDDNLYRINTSYVGEIYINKVGSIKELKPTMYSSNFNHDYREAYKNLFDNPVKYRNKFVISGSNNLLFEMYTGEKYFYTKQDFNNIYDKIYKNDDIKLYENDYVLPIAYATTRNINIDDFNKLSYPDNIINMLGSVVSSDKTNIDLINSEDIILDYSLIDTDNVKYEKTSYGYYLDANYDSYIDLKVNNDLTGKILFISFDILENVSCDENWDLAIKINDIRNTLTCSGWKYNNENSHFSYTLVDNDNLNIRINKGKYKIGNISVKALDFNKIKNISKEVDEFIFNKDKTKGNRIVGSITVKEDSNFIMSIPYDKGFNVYVDNKKVDYYKANNAFIGFKINKGNHDIRIIYKAPYKNIGCVISLVGIVSFISIVIYENKKYLKKENS